MHVTRRVFVFGIEASWPHAFVDLKALGGTGAKSIMSVICVVLNEPGGAPRAAGDVLVAA